MKRTFVVFALVLLAAPFVGAAEPRQCNPTGTWYGGSEWKYVLTITPNEANSYVVEFREAYNLEPFGYSNGSAWSGQMVRRGARNFELRALAMYAFPSDGVTPPSTELDLIHGTMRLKDACDTIVHTIDVYGAYVPYTDETEPFVTEVDVDYLPGEGTLVEIYHRMKQLK
jgi:hypothetical protein